jgi:hypothetical protein
MRFAPNSLWPAKAADPVGDVMAQNPAFKIHKSKLNLQE